MLGVLCFHLFCISYLQIFVTVVGLFVWSFFHLIYIIYKRLPQ